jgi:hypothetical protein
MGAAWSILRSILLPYFVMELLCVLLQQLLASVNLPVIIDLLALPVRPDGYHMIMGPIYVSMFIDNIRLRAVTEPIHHGRSELPDLLVGESLPRLERIRVN